VSGFAFSVHVVVSRGYPFSFNKNNHIRRGLGRRIAFLRVRYSRGRGEWPSGQKRQTVNLLKFFYVGSNPASPTCLL
jgi:hypothetical protein